MVYSREASKTDTLLAAKIVYDKEIMEKNFPNKSIKDYEKLIWNDIKEINKTLPDYKHIKKIKISDEPMEKTTTQKIKRYQEIKKADEV